MLFPTTTTTTAVLALAASLPAVLANGSTSCDSAAGTNTDPSDAAACANELTARGEAGELCRTKGGFTETFCTYGSAKIVGLGLEHSTSGGAVSASCVDIAVAVGEILDQCTHDDGQG